MTESIELAVVGAGPAGLAAAVEAAGLGLPVTLVDAFALPGGQYYKQTPPELGATAPPDKHAAYLLDGIDHDAVRLLTGTSVWGLFPEDDGYLLCLYGPPGTPRRVKARAVILAPGAHDRPVPFPGWTLPGVITAGAALTMVKHQHVLPGRRILLSGTGPLQLVLARHLIDAGAELAGVLDANGFPWSGWRHAGAVWGQWERLREGWESLRTMQRAGVGIRWRHQIVRAEGEGQVERAAIGPVPNADRKSLTETVPVDTICLGFGFIPSIQLSRLAGCEHTYRPEQRIYTPVRDEGLQTTLPGLFVVGDGARIGGKDVARLEGQLAALGAARSLGQDIAPARIADVQQALARQRRFAGVLDALFPYSTHLADLLTDDTILCRCEEITVGEVRRAIAEGATTVSAIRMLTRAGMGRCQGRMCGSSVAELVAQELGQPVEAAGLPTPRPPVVPIPLDGLIDDEEA
ncbi:MAG: NAD(P)/FAD-dependent oxidoreductase [Anaerolineae bacterium]|jgi:NADPH-dependent 2,4-dienoyl-CoA reductase/sulfur reductase-like enzyme